MDIRPMGEIFSDRRKSQHMRAARMGTLVLTGSQSMDMLVHVGLPGGDIEKLSQPFAPNSGRSSLAYAVRTPCWPQNCTAEHGQAAF